MDALEAVAAWRAATPGCEDVVHLNNAGASLPPAVVLDTVIEHLELEARLGGYEAAEQVAEREAGVRASIGRLLGCDASEVALVESATRAWDMAFYALPLGPGDAIVTGVAEYASNYLPYLHAEATRGVQVRVVPDGPDGAIDVDALAASLDDLGPRAALVALTHVPTNGGLVNRAEAVGEVARAAGVPYLLDACQSVGQLQVDVEAIGCDFLSFTGRKFVRGPRGTGALYVRAEVAEQLHPPFVDLHAAEWVERDGYELAPGARRFESWERSVALRLGLGAAVDDLLAIGLDVVEARVARLGARLRELLAELPGVTVHDKGSRRCAIVTCSHESVPAEVLVAGLRAAGINTSVSRASSSRLDFEQRALPDLVRLSPHLYTSDDELDRAVATLRTLLP